MQYEIAITSWYFNPLHPWHIECFRLSKMRARKLFVIVNNDNQARVKRWCEPFMNEYDRLKIVQSLKYVTMANIATDQDQSVCQTIQEIYDLYPDSRICFTKWWDRFADNIPEAILCKKLWIDIVDWLWPKTHNSSDFIK